MSLLNITNLRIDLKQRRTRVPVIRDVSLSVPEGQVCGLVGESGAGKSMIAKAILGLLPRSARIASGQILFNSENLLSLKPAALQKLIGHRIALIPQDPMSSLNPVRRIGAQLSDGLHLHLGLDKVAARKRSLELLAEVLIKDPARVYDAYAHELSGGMRQRVLIAMAFSSEPALIIADEPTTALDVTVQKRVLSLIRDLQRKKNTSLLFVTHDLGVVAKVCDSVVVLFDGRVLEQSDAATLFTQPSHAYSAALLNAMPRYDQPEKPAIPISTELIRALSEETLRLDGHHVG